jgi:hypothetical protein
MKSRCCSMVQFLQQFDLLRHGWINNKIHFNSRILTRLEAYLSTYVLFHESRYPLTCCDFPNRLFSSLNYLKILPNPCDNKLFFIDRNLTLNEENIIFWKLWIGFLKKLEKNLFFQFLILIKLNWKIYHSLMLCNLILVPEVVTSGEI